jgi:ferredoxin-NADP reductase
MPVTLPCQARDRRWHARYRGVSRSRWGQASPARAVVAQRPDRCAPILSFALPTTRGFWGRRSLPRFEAGDLVAILAPGTDLPRFYSLASASTDDVLEICVRKQPGGLCSGFLHELPPGGRIEAFIRPNPSFRPSRGKAPVILIGAGTGIGPLAGFIRHNSVHRPMHLYWGGRHPSSDFLYGPELRQYVDDGRLARLNTAFSREPGGAISRIGCQPMHRRCASPCSRARRCWCAAGATWRAAWLALSRRSCTLWASTSQP